MRQIFSKYLYFAQQCTIVQDTGFFEVGVPGGGPLGILKSGLGYSNCCENGKSMISFKKGRVKLLPWVVDRQVAGGLVNRKATLLSFIIRK